MPISSLRGRPCSYWRCPPVASVATPGTSVFFARNLIRCSLLTSDGSRQKSADLRQKRILFLHPPNFSLQRLVLLAQHRRFLRKAHCVAGEGRGRPPDDLPVPLSATRTACPLGYPVPSPSFLFRELQVSTCFIPYQNLLFQGIRVLIPKKFRRKNRQNS